MNELKSEFESGAREQNEGKKRIWPFRVARVAVWLLNIIILYLAFATVRFAFTCGSDSCIAIFFGGAVLLGTMLVQGLIVLPIYLHSEGAHSRQASQEGPV